MKKKLAILIGLLAVGAVGSSVALGTIFSSADEELSFTIEALQTSYGLNESFIVPDATATLDGKSYEPEHTLLYPDGRESGYDTATLDMYGEYRLTYYFEANGETYSETKTFTVEAGDYTSLFTNVKGCTITQNVDANSWSDFDINGVGITFASTGGTFRYNGVIDLNDKKKTEAFIELIGNPSDDVVGATDAMRCFTSLTFTLTDINDENNYLEIVASDDDVLTTRVTTSACGMYTRYGMLVSDGNLVSNSRGPQIFSSLAGKPPTMTTASNTFGLSYTSSDKTLWGLAKPERGNGTLILDYDDPTMVESQYLWDGFSTNQVYLTVKAKTRYSKEASIIVTSVNGQDLSGEGKAIPTDITINADTFGYAENELPDGSLGKEYPVFEASAYDNYGMWAGEVDALVRDPDGNAVPVVKGKFKTEKGGRYSITYSAKNAYVHATKTLYVNVGNVYNKPTYTASELIPETVSTGEKVYLYDGMTSGGVGKMTVDVKITRGETEIPVQDYGLGKYFIAELGGDYLLTYTVTDQIGDSHTYEKVVSAFDSPTPVMAEPSVSRVNIVGRKVTLPLAEAVLYKGAERLHAAVRVYFDETEITETMSYTPETAGLHTVRYVAESPVDGMETEYTFTVEAKKPTQESNDIYVSNFLKFDGFDGSYSDQAYRLTAKEGVQEAQAQFLTAIPQQILDFEFAIETGKGNFETAYVYLTDSEKAGERIAISLSRVTWEGKERVALYVNGMFVARIGGSLNGGDLTTFLFKYDWENKAILDRTGARLATITCTETGESFTGFSSGRVYFTIAAKKIEGECQIKLIKVAGQGFSNATADKIEPSLVGIADEVAQKHEAFVGDKYTFADLQAFDVLDNAYCDIYVTVRGPSSTVPTYSDALVKGHTIELTQAGTYTVIYSAKDAAGNPTSQTCYILVKEFNAPAIAVENMITSATVGTKVTLPTATVTDDTSALAQITTYIYVIDANGQRETVIENEYTFRKAGTYTVRYVAVDNSGNRAVAEYTVTAA